MCPGWSMLRPQKLQKMMPSSSHSQNFFSCLASQRNILFTSMYSTDAPTTLNDLAVHHSWAQHISKQGESQAHTWVSLKSFTPTQYTIAPRSRDLLACVRRQRGLKGDAGASVALLSSGQLPSMKGFPSTDSATLRQVTQWRSNQDLRELTL